MKRIGSGSSTPQTDEEKKAARLNAKILKAVVAARDHAIALADELSNAAELIAEGQSSANAIRIEYVAKWEKRTGDSYVGSVARDTGIIRTLRRQLQDEDLRERLDLYLRDTDGFVVRNAWSLGLFARKVNSYGKASRQLQGRGAQSSDADLFEEQVAARRGKR